MDNMAISLSDLEKIDLTIENLRLTLGNIINQSKENYFSSGCGTNECGWGCQGDCDGSCDGWTCQDNNN